MREYWARLLEEAKFGEGGLLPAVVQDIRSGDVLMVAYMSRAAMGKTIETGEAWFWSRSRQSLWNKGETSGNKMLVKRMALDCDRDTLLLQVEPLGPACHTGAASCFISEEPTDESDKVVRFEGENVLAELDEQIKDRKENPVEGSYTNKLLDAGIERILRKVGEESGEFIIAAMNAKGGDAAAKRLAAEELADLIYHAEVALTSLGSSFHEVEKVLVERRGAKRRSESKKV